MSNDDDNDDYMSDKFLEQAVATNFLTQKEKTYTERRREHLREQQKKAYIKPRAQLEKEAREEGLKRKFDESNKGMKMLMKMGFKKGMTIGKQRPDALEEPIAVQMKRDRIGLGMDTMLKRQREQEEEDALAKAKKANADPDGFRHLMAQRAKESHISRQIMAGAHIIERLDSAKDITDNLLWSLLPPEPVEEEAQDDAGSSKEEEFNPVVVEVEDEDEEGELEMPKDERTKEIEALKALPLEEQLDHVVTYLRTAHLYCFWCAAQYNDDQDLAENCPGLSEDDH